MPDQTTATTKPAPDPERLSLTALVIVLTVSSAAFVSQALPYVS